MTAPTHPPAKKRKRHKITRALAERLYRHGLHVFDADGLRMENIFDFKPGKYYIHSGETYVREN